MAGYQVDPSSGSRLIGGEMAQWSDLVGEPSASAARPLLAAVLSTVPAPGRVLLLGPGAALMVDALPATSCVDVLVRGLPDARRLSTQGRLRSDVGIYCGGVDRLAPAAAYDLVVALDGPGTVCSPDSRGLGHVDLLRLIGSWTTPGGVVVGAVANELAFDRLFGLELRSVLDDDSQWHRGAEGFDDRALYHRELASALAAAGWWQPRTYAAWPGAGTPTLLVDGDRLDDDTVRCAASVLASRAASDVFSRRPALADAYELVQHLVESGLAVDFAPAWLVVARAGGDDGAWPGGEGAAPGEDLPALVCVDRERAPWRAVTTLERGEGGWSYRLRATGAAEVRERQVVRDCTALPSALPAARSLESVLRRACAAGDIGTVRRLVRRYAGWLRDPASWAGAGVPEDRAASAVARPPLGARFFAVPSNVVLEGSLDSGRLHCLDPSWRFEGRLGQDELATRGLRDFARRLLGSGAEHPWTPDITPDALTQTLTSMAGVPWRPGLLDAVARAEAEVEITLAGGDAVQEALAYVRNLEEGGSRAAAAAGPRRGYREALATGGRLAGALHERTGQVEWLEATLRARDTRVRELEQTLDAVRGSVSFGAGRVLTWPLRAAAGGLRRAGMSVLPPGLLRQATRVLRRLSAEAARTSR